MMKNKILNMIMLLPGFILALSIAAVAKVVEGLLPMHVVGASVIALFAGMIINSFWRPAWAAPGLKFTSKKILKFAIILLGASLSVNVILEVGKMSLMVMVFTLLTCFGGIVGVKVFQCRIWGDGVTSNFTEARVFRRGAVHMISSGSIIVRLAPSHFYWIYPRTIGIGFSKTEVCSLRSSLDDGCKGGWGHHSTELTLNITILCDNFVVVMGGNFHGVVTVWT